jgi:transketolase
MSGESGRFVDRPYGHALERLGREHPRLVVVDADLQRATETDLFQKSFPDRYFDVGIAEADMVGISVGLALSGKTVFCGTFASFVSQRAADQVFVSVAYCRADVKLVGVEPGLSSGRNGASHQALADLGIMRSFPGMVVCDPGDAVETAAVMECLAAHTGPAYMRAPRGRTPVVHEGGPLTLLPGKALALRRGKDAAVFACGMMLPRALEAVDALRAGGIDAGLYSMPFLKPLDEEAVLEAAAEAGCIVTAENHSVLGGLGSAVAEVVTSNRPVPVMRIGIRDSFGQVGDLDWLARQYSMDTTSIMEAVRTAMKKKIDSRS